jgi:hypothetical protein
MNVLGAKRMELASELVPQANGIALLVNQNNPNAEVDAAELRAAAEALGKRTVVLKASSDSEIEDAFIAASEHKLGALFVNIDPFLFNHRELLALMAARYRLPTIYPLRDFVSAGGLMRYGANFANAWHQSGIYVGKILRGTKPTDLRVLQPTKIELVINLNTAKALGIDVPAKLLARADEVIACRRTAHKCDELAPLHSKVFVDAFLKGMQEFGYVEASNFDIVYRYADGYVERLPPLAEEIVRLHPDVILAPASGPAVAAK